MDGKKQPLERPAKAMLSREIHILVRELKERKKRLKTERIFIIFAISVLELGMCMWG